MTIELAIQRATVCTGLPTDGQFRRWASAALQDRRQAELTIRLVDRDEARALNHRFRGKDAPTNVLSFPADLPADLDLPLLGDVVICAPLVAEEAAAQGKSGEAHWAHLTIHGLLHLLGFDHQRPADAELMEGLEKQLLAGLGIADPYA